MHDDRDLVEGRIEKLRERIALREVSVVAKLSAEAWQAPGEPVPFDVAADGDYRPFPVGTWWGPAWSTWWLKLRGEVPAELRNSRLELRIDLGFVGEWAGNQSEGMVFTPDGTPLKAVNPMNRTVPLNHGRLADELAAAGRPLVGDDGTVEFVVEAAANPDMTHYMGTPTQQGDRLTASDEPVWRYGGAEVVVRDANLFGLALDLDVLEGLMLQLPEHSTRRARILRGLERAADVVDSGDMAETASAAREVLAPLIAGGANASAQKMTAIGHAHIDSAWLWPIRETKRKVLRTFSNVTALADEYPDFHFACTSAQHYQWLKEASPEVFGRVRDAIDRGQWHAVGGMWVESDTNLPGGEALVRQLTSGLRWMRDELGVRPDCLWLPDSFGYTGALPQIARLAGMRWFFTQKLSWNRLNKLPHHTFWWEGIDGTRIWTHFPPVDCYDSIVSAEEIVRAERNFKEKGATAHSLLPFGYGDGGGGPIREMMERVHRFADMEDAPVVTPGSPDEFFRAAVEDYAEPPVWSGELYLEFHRGVYTTQAELKRGNRRTEHGLAAVELLASMAVRANPDYRYPQEALEQLWRRMLLLQFHDILPGSSTSWVNREAAAEYRALAGEIETLLDEAWVALRSDAPSRSLLNASPFDRREVVAVGDALTLVEVPALAVAPAESAGAPEHPVTLRRDGDVTVLDNGLVRVGIGADGTIVSLRDLIEDREVLLPGGRGNLLRLHPDHPSAFDAWELEDHYDHQGTDVDGVASIEATVVDDLRVRVEVTREFGKSRAIQSISLDADSRTVDFGLWIDWKEREHVLKVGFPLDVRAARTSAEIQFGHIERPIAPNTSWDKARFETSGHRWMLLEEPGYGVAIANGSSYGHDVLPAGGSAGTATSGVHARLTLLRAPQAPDPLADLGEHRMGYSLTLGADVQAASRAGLRVNQPLRVLEGAATVESVARVVPADGTSFAVIDSVKRAFDDSGDLVVRLHEAAGARSKVALVLSDAATSIGEVDLLEDPIDEPTQALPAGGVAAGEPIALRLRPFQILTLRIRAAR